MKGLAALLLSLCAYTDAYAGCTHKVQIETIPVTYTVRTDAAARDIAKVAGISQTPGRIILGAAVGKTIIKPTDNSDQCLDITIAVGYEPITVYIANEIADDLCANNRVLSHELEHVDRYRDFLSNNKGRLDAIASGIESYEEANDALMRIYELMKTVLSYQKEIDTEAHYRSNRTACNGAIARAF